MSQNEPTVNFGYFRTVPGLLKISELLVCVISIICVASGSWMVRGGGFVWFTVVSAFINTAIAAVLYLLQFNTTITRVPWALLEVIYSAFWAICFLISFIISAVGSANYRSAGFGVAAFFCVVGAALFALDCLYYFRRHQRRNDIPVPINPPADKNSPFTDNL